MRKKFLIVLIYLITSLLFAFKNINFGTEFSSITFLLNDNRILENLEISIKSDYNTDTIFLTRLFHNKPFAYFETFFVQLSRSLDLLYLFPFSGQAKYFHIIEFPFFAFSIVYLIRKIDRLSGKYSYIISLLVLSLLINGLFLPETNLIKIIPLIITMKIVILLGIFEFISNNLVYFSNKKKK